MSNFMFYFKVLASPCSFTTTVTRPSWGQAPSRCSQVSLLQENLQQNQFSFVSPGADVEVAVTTQITVTTEDALTGFTPEERGCYACHEVNKSH